VSRRELIGLKHGSGGVEMTQILERLFFRRVPEDMKVVPGGLGIDWPDDAAALPVDGGYVVVTVDSYTVNPIFFPGGDIGTLAASGTINDVLMLGGRPISVLDSIVVEEGFPVDELERIVDSFLGVLEGEGVRLVGGDFKVMPRGQVDKIVITSVGLGFGKRFIADKSLRPGDKLLVSGYVGDHGATILALQQGLDVSKSGLRSDCRPLTKLMLPLLDRYGEWVHAARDPTRGGLAMTLNDWARASRLLVVLNMDRVPIRPYVSRYAHMLGIDPLSLASEGVALLAVSGEVAEEVLESVRRLGFEDAVIVGEARESEKFGGLAVYRSEVGGLRILEPPSGELVPRIC